mmetsp:Transcript_37114/g.97741  ORF Transcript_37114/g.97741 Transcript_37114/m.97741 type:complete len:168 (+) Transcript_37114:1105-1608(+)
MRSTLAAASLDPKDAPPQVDEEHRAQKAIESPSAPAAKPDPKHRCVFVRSVAGKPLDLQERQPAELLERVSDLLAAISVPAAAPLVICDACVRVVTLPVVGTIDAAPEMARMKGFCQRFRGPNHHGWRPCPEPPGLSEPTAPTGPTATAGCPGQARGAARRRPESAP